MNALAPRYSFSPGFADPVMDSQAVFRAVLTALSRPGLPMALPARLAPPSPLTPELAALALALADGDAPIWLDPALAAAPAVADFLRFHTGAPITPDPSEAAYGLVLGGAALPDLAIFAQGSDAYPDRSTTLLVAVDGFAGPAPIVLAGPGVRGRVSIAAESLPSDLPARLAANRALFPRGVDIVLVGPGEVVGLPRSVQVVREPAARAEAASGRSRHEMGAA